MNVRISLCKADDQQQDKRAKRNSAQAHGKHIRASAVPVCGKAEHAIRNVQRHQWNQQVGCLGDEVGGAVFRRREIAGVKPHHQKYK